MKIHVINLARSRDRREAVRAQLDHLELDHDFFHAVDGKSADILRFPNWNEEYCLSAWRRPLSPGEAGCFASHYSLWQRCVDDDEPIIVLEDSAGLSPRFAEAISILPTGLESFDYIRLAGIRVPPIHSRKSLRDEWDLVEFSGNPLGTQCYVISPPGAARLIRGAAKWLMPVDAYMNNCWMHGVTGASLFPLVAWRRKISSDIRPSDEAFPNPVPRSKRIARRLADAVQRLTWNAFTDRSMKRTMRRTHVEASIS